MKTPICKVCVASDILCSGCEGKLKSGEISDEDISVARALVKLSERHPFAEHNDFNRTVKHKDMLLIMVPKGGAGNFIGRKGIFIKELSEMLGQRKVKVVEETSNQRDLVQSILYPTEVFGVNIVYHGKKQSYKVRVPNSAQSRIGDKKDFEELFGNLLGAKTEIVFE